MERFLLCLFGVQQVSSYSWRTTSPDLPGTSFLTHYGTPNSWNFEHRDDQVYSPQRCDNTEVARNVTFRTDSHLYTKTDACSGSNPSLGTCDVKNWGKDPNYQMCQTEWITKQGTTMIPNCGASLTQICMLLGLGRSKAGKTIFCKVASNPTSQGRNWFVEVGDGSMCRVACFDASPMGRFTFQQEIDSSDGPTDAPLCVPDSIYLDGTNSHCSTAPNKNYSEWQVEASSKHPATNHECSGRCYSAKPSYMYGIRTFHSPSSQPLPDVYQICYLSNTFQDNNSKIGTCQVSMVKDKWIFEEKGGGIGCYVACSCGLNSSPYCKKLNDDARLYSTEHIW